jgi:hypothetical protein
MLIGGRQSIIHVRTHAATSCRQHADNMPTAQLSAALRSRPSEASGPSPRLPQEHPPPLPRGRGARPLRASRGRRGLARPPPPRRPSDHPRAAYGKPVWRPRRGCRGILARAFRGRLRRLRGASRVPSPDLRSRPRQTLGPFACLHLGCLRLGRAVVPTCLRAPWVAREVYDVDGDAVIA